MVTINTSRSFAVLLLSRFILQIRFKIQVDKKFGTDQTVGEFELDVGELIEGRSVGIYYYIYFLVQQN